MNQLAPWKVIVSSMKNSYINFFYISISKMKGKSSMDEDYWEIQEERHRQRLEYIEWLEGYEEEDGYGD